MTQREPSQQAMRRSRGFRHASGLVARDVARAGEGRGFAVTRLLTQWAEIAGAQVATVALPLRVSYARGGLGATLTLLVRGADAPVVQAQVPQIIARVNACYGYAAISRITLTQTAPDGFAEGQTPFDAPPPATPAIEPDPAVRQAAEETASPVRDEGLRHALEALGENVLSRAKPRRDRT